MLTKEEAESFVPPEVSRKKKKQQNNKKFILTDDETICTVNKDDVEDNGSVFEDSKQAHDNATWNDNIDDGKPSILQLGSGEECTHDDSNHSVDMGISLPCSKKRARLMSYQDSLNELQSKYNELLLKTENLCKTVVYWKSCHIQTVQMQDPSSQTPCHTRVNIVDQLMNDMVISEDQFVSLKKQKHFVSCNNI